jgi:hypothetical protein
VLTELRNRGIREVLIVCCYGLTGLITSIVDYDLASASELAASTTKAGRSRSPLTRSKPLRWGDRALRSRSPQMVCQEI